MPVMPANEATDTMCPESRMIISGKKLFTVWDQRIVIELIVTENQIGIEVPKSERGY